jgi:hypothetical protein
MAPASATPENVNHGASVGDCDTLWPRKMLAITRTNPMMEHSSTFPGRQ